MQLGNDTNMTTLYLIRHAEAEGNLYRRIHGQYDSLITENGYQQIEALTQRFREIRIDAVYSSDMFRTKTTAQAICKPHNLPLETRKDLREISMGIWEDKTWGETYRTDAAAMELFGKSSPDWRVEKGETLGELRQRITEAVLDIGAKHDGQTVAIFCHGTAIRQLIAGFQGLSIADSRKLSHSDNTAVTLVELSGGEATVQYHDDNSHLREEISTLARQNWWKKEQGQKVKSDDNVWYQPMELAQMAYRGLYLSARQEAWMDLGRDVRLIDRQNYLEQAVKSAGANPNYLLCAQVRNNIIGILQLDPEQYAKDNAGYISFFYILPEYRGQGLGVQMIGQAVSTYRPMGRDKLRLVCGADNENAKRFYERHGFCEVETCTREYGKVHILEKYIGYKEP